MITANRPDGLPATAPAAIPKLPVALDTKGRVRTSPEQRHLILTEFERSGVSAAQFARATGLKYPTLAAWVQRHRRTKRPERPPPVRLLEAVLPPAPAAAAEVVMVHLPGGARLEIREAGQVPLAAALMVALARPC